MKSSQITEMKPIICVLVLAAIVAVHSAPALLTQQYLLITPEAQLQLTPALKLQQPFLQPITQVKKIANVKNGETKEILLYYPNTPYLVQYSQGIYDLPFKDWLAALRRWCQQERQGKPNEEAQQSGKLEFENDAETISPSPAPAAPIPNFPLGGESQFYGNFAGLNDPTNPLYAFQPILTKGRSVETGNKALSNENVETAPTSDVAERSLPEKILTQTEPRFQSKYPAVLYDDESNSAAKLKGKVKSFQKGSENKSASEEQNLNVSDDPTVARARPSKIENFR